MIIFSDIDGTLAYYAWQLEGVIEVKPGAKEGEAIVRYPELGIERECVVLPSQRTGDGYVSKRTIELVQELRKQGVLFVLSTGARSTTYLQRRKLLPAADFEAFESGGRIWHRGEPDLAWSKRLFQQTGFAGAGDAQVPPPSERHGSLWDLYKEMEAEGWDVDGEGYFTQFRIRHSPDKETRRPLGDFVREEWGEQVAQLGLTITSNLGNVDVLPALAGKANAARYILEKLKMGPEHAVAIFDDENDLELGQLCGRGYLPGISHSSVATLLKSERHWEAMPHRGPLGAEEALEKVLDLVKAARLET